MTPGTPSHLDRLNIWRYTLARASLIEARQTALTLLKERLEMTAAMEDVLMQHLVIAYTRPFTRWTLTHEHRWTPLSAKLVPERFREIHRQHEKMRNSLIAHKDAVAGAAEAPSFNQVVIWRVSDKIGLQASTPGGVEQETLELTVQLCEFLVRHCATELKKFTHHFHSLADGAYVMSLEANPAQWIKTVIDWRQKKQPVNGPALKQGFSS